MPTFPTMSSGAMKVHPDQASDALMKYPSTLVQSYETRIVRFVADTEQRWIARKRLFSAELQFNGMSGHDTSVLRDFFYEQKGSYVTSSGSTAFDITIAGVTYENCVFDQDEFNVEIDRRETFTFSLRVRQLPN